MTKTRSTPATSPVLILRRITTGTTIALVVFMALEHGVPLAKATSDTAFADTDQALDTGDTGLYTTPIQRMGIQLQQAGTSSSSSSFFHPLATSDATTLRDQLIASGDAANSDEAFALMTYGVESSELTQGQTSISTFVYETQFEPGLPPATDTNPPATADATPTTSAAIDAILAVGAPDGDPNALVPITLLVDMDRSIVPDLMLEVEKDVLSGSVVDEATWDQATHDHFETRDAHGNTLLAALETSLLNEGAVLGDTHGWSGLQDMEVPWNKLDTVAALSGVMLIDLNDPSLYVADGDVDQTGPDQGFSINGEELARLIQSKVYYDNGHKAGGTRGVVREDGAEDINWEHEGFSSLNNTTRLMSCELQANTNMFGVPICIIQQHPKDTDPLSIPDIANCATIPDPQDAVHSRHATSVASLMFGDISDGEHGSNWSAGSDGAVRRSWVARDATGTGLDVRNLSLEADYIDHPSTDIHVANYSFSFGTNSSQFCSHNDAISISLSSSFEAGVFMVTSVGNTGNQRTYNCTANPPAAALGAFSVGAYEFTTSAGDECYRDNGIDCLTPGIRYWSSYGPQSVAGSDRTIVDAVAPSWFELTYTHYFTPRGGNGFANFYGLDRGVDDFTPPDCEVRSDSDGDGLTTHREWGAFSETSAATPIISGAALLFRGWALPKLGLFIDDARHMFTTMLMMGDRDQLNSATLGHRESGFDGTWGAGLLRMRMFDEVGMDDPAKMSWGETCVLDGQSTIIPIDATRINSDVDYIKAVAFHFDDDFHDASQPGPLDWTRMYLQSRPTGSSGPWQTLRADEKRDNKHRVYSEVQANTDYRLMFDGTDIESLYQGCGWNGTRVHFAILTEDNDRDDITLDAVVEPEQ